MSSEKVTVTFDTRRLADVPRIGQRKHVKVNGKIETLYVSDLDVNCTVDEEWSDDGHGGSIYRGRYKTYSGAIILQSYSRMQR